ncbi:MAG: MFS transporter [Gemmatimonadetes bacterium]|nr:MFS transporter [Gemmatimonadota bacterium]
MSESERGLPPVVKSLGLVSFFNDLASEMIYPLIPALVASLGGGALSLGLFDGISEALSAAAKLWSGFLADRPRLRRPLILAGYGIAAVTRPVIGATTAAWQVIALRATDRVGKGLRTPPRDAVIADAVTPDMRGRAFGFHRAMDHAGAVVGPLVAWLLLSQVGLSPDRVIVWSVVPGLIAVLAVFWAVRGEAGSGKGEADNPFPLPASPFPNNAKRQPNSLLYLIVLFAFARFPEMLFLLRLKDLGLPVALTPLVWAALHVIRTTLSYPGGRLSDSLGPKSVMLGGWFAYWLVCMAMATITSPWSGVGWFLVFGLVAALTESPERALVAAAARDRGVGKTFGIYHASVGIAGLLGGITFGMVYARMGGPAALIVSGLAGGVLALALLLGPSSKEPAAT